VVSAIVGIVIALALMGLGALGFFGALVARGVSEGREQEAACSWAVFTGALLVVCMALGVLGIVP
jgi:hypothetical protein